MRPESEIRREVQSQIAGKPWEYTATQYVLTYTQLITQWVSLGLPKADLIAVRRTFNVTLDDTAGVS